MKFKAAVLVQQKQALVLDELEVPALKYGQVLVRVLCSGICGSQLGEIDGVKGPDKFLPHLLGHEGTGEVLETGEGVKHVKVGDRVVLHWRKGAGIESPTPVYRSASLGRVNAGWVTAFNEMAVISENRVTPIPKDFDPEAGALLGCAVTTAFGVVNNNARVRIGESVVVFGVGGIGLNVVQACALASAHPIIAVDLFDNKLDLAQKLGATHLVNSAQTDAISEISKLLPGGAADVVIENTGNVSVIETAYRLTSARGRLILVGVPQKGQEAHIYTLPLHFSKTIGGSHGGESQPEVDIPRYVRLCEVGKLAFKMLVSRRCTLNDINEVIADMRHGNIAGRTIVTM